MKYPKIYTRVDIIREMATVHEKIIDIGCHCAETFGDRATNVDIASLEKLREAEKNPNLVIPNFIHADGENLYMIKDGEYDVAVVMEVLEHTNDPLKLLNEAQRVARVIIICVPNEYEWNPIHTPFQNTDHKRQYTDTTFMQLIYESKMTIIQYIHILYSGWSYMIAECLSKNVNTTNMI